MFKKILIALLIILLGVGAFLYFGTFSEGVRAGIVMKISKRGILFKTYEGQMNLETFGAVKSKNIVSETFSFSVEDTDLEVVKALEDAARTGKRVNVRYKERFIVVPWRGETKYFVYAVEGLDDEGKTVKTGRKSPIDHSN